MIFEAILTRQHPRQIILAPTRYGKSLMIALALLLRVTVYKEKWTIISGKQEQARVILNHLIQHVFDNDLFASQLELEGEPIERLKRERSKNRLTFKRGGEIKVMSANAKSAQSKGQGLLGSGSPNIIIDESSLIPDGVYGQIVRMLGDQPDNCLIELGNPFYRNHFHRSWKNPKYHKIFVDDKQALEEGRYTEDYLDEMRDKTNYQVLYECLFPEESMIDEEGFSTLFQENTLERAKQFVMPFGEKRLGCDIAEGGGDNNALTLRYANYARILGKFKQPDTMKTTGTITDMADKFDLLDQNIFVDSIGVGKGVYDRLTEQHRKVSEVKFSEQADDPTQFANRRAECYWRFSKWLNEGGNLEPSDEWNALLSIKYKVDSSGRIQLMSKDDMRRRGLSSPDVCDSVAITFNRQSVMNKSYEQAKEEREMLKNFDANARKKHGNPYMVR